MNQPTIKMLMLLFGLTNQPPTKSIGINSQTVEGWRLELQTIWEYFHSGDGFPDVFLCRKAETGHYHAGSRWRVASSGLARLVRPDAQDAVPGMGWSWTALVGFFGLWMAKATLGLDRFV